MKARYNFSYFGRLYGDAYPPLAPPCARLAVPCRAVVVSLRRAWATRVRGVRLRPWAVGRMPARRRAAEVRTVVILLLTPPGLAWPRASPAQSLGCAGLRPSRSALMLAAGVAGVAVCGGGSISAWPSCVHTVTRRGGMGRHGVARRGRERRTAAGSGAAQCHRLRAAAHFRSSRAAPRGTPPSLASAWRPITLVSPHQDEVGTMTRCSWRPGPQAGWAEGPRGQYTRGRPSGPSGRSGRHSGWRRWRARRGQAAPKRAQRHRRGGRITDCRAGKTKQEPARHGLNHASIFESAKILIRRIKKVKLWIFSEV